MDISSLAVHGKHQIQFQYSIPIHESSMSPGLNPRRNRSFEVVRFQAAANDPFMVNSASFSSWRVD